MLINNRTRIGVNRNTTIKLVVKTILYTICIIGIIAIFIIQLQRPKYELILPNDQRNGAWSSWSDWSFCKGLCTNTSGQNIGQSYRFRKCNSPIPGKLGKPCAGLNDEITECIIMNCTQQKQIESKWSQWSEFSVCSSTCQMDNAISYKTRVRKCLEQNSEAINKSCVGKFEDIEFCKSLPKCPVNGAWSSWSNWSPCVGSCTNKSHQNFGQTNRTRKCDSPVPEKLGEPCAGLNKETTECIILNCTQQKPIESKWSEWSEFSVCSSTCQLDNAIVYKTRVRKCLEQNSEAINKSCVGKFEDIELCKNLPKCPVNGAWSSWSNWSPCVGSCANISSQNFGQTHRVRKCDSPAPGNLGEPCAGLSKETTECIILNCTKQFESKWSEWSEFSACSSSCQLDNAISYRSRIRKCLEQGIDSNKIGCVGKSEDAEYCKGLPKCPESTSTWSEWKITKICESSTNKPCSLGSMLQERSCPTDSCPGLSRRKIDCWYALGCPVPIQTPNNLQVNSLDGWGFFNVSWNSVPYGAAAVLYKVYQEIIDYMGNLQDIEITSVKPPIREETQPIVMLVYRLINKIKQYEQLGEQKFANLRVRVSAIDARGSESQLTIAEYSDPAKVDGQWSEWDYWTDCSAKCRSEVGKQSRERTCLYKQLPEYPDEMRSRQSVPRKVVVNGKYCVGSDQEIITCRVMYPEC